MRDKTFEEGGPQDLPKRDLPKKGSPKKGSPKKDLPKKSQAKRHARLYRLPTRLTYAAVINKRNEETEISELMIRRACDEMEQYQQFPFAPRERSAS